MFKHFNVLLRTVVLGGLVALGGWWTFFLRDELQEHERALEARDQEIESLAEDVREREHQIAERDGRIAEQEEQIAALDQAVQELEASLWLLKVDHRLARVEVLEQVPAPGSDDPEAVTTRVRFTEIDEAGQPLGEGQEFVVEGRKLYVEALVIKFEDDYVEKGDFLRGTSLGLFKRAFGERQKPSEGVLLDTVGMRPLPYQGDDLPNPFYLDLWERFWDYANDPELAAERGVRAMGGEAPFTELRPGKTYRVELRASGGLTIRPE